MATEPVFGDVDDVITRFDEYDYLLDTGTATAVYLAVTLARPLLLEGEPGVGKTTAAKTLAAVLGSPLIRLQCYEGLTAGEALYDWNHQRQLLSIRLAEARGEAITETDLYTERYLLDRPILRCVRHRGPTPPVLLIDEIAAPTTNSRHCCWNSSASSPSRYRRSAPSPRSVRRSPC